MGDYQVKRVSKGGDGKPYHQQFISTIYETRWIVIQYLTCFLRVKENFHQIPTISPNKKSEGKIWGNDFSPGLDSIA